MASTSLAHTAHETIPEHRLRGAGLFETYSAKILGNYQGGRLWLIPCRSRPYRCPQERRMRFVR
jgi:hypothetical protein